MKTGGNSAIAICIATNYKSEGDFPHASKEESRNQEFNFKHDIGDKKTNFQEVNLDDKPLHSSLILTNLEYHAVSQKHLKQN